MRQLGEQLVVALRASHFHAHPKHWTGTNRLSPFALIASHPTHRIKTPSSYQARAGSAPHQLILPRPARGGSRARCRGACSHLLSIRFQTKCMSLGRSCGSL
eukprot:scaffold267196_cov41-Prasinocladus_malaysianus.AAC.1